MLWKWKRAETPDDVLHLLNGETRYDRPVPDARICMSWRGDHPSFWVFARRAARTDHPHDGIGSWAWKAVSHADDVVSFLRGDAPGRGEVVKAEVAGAWTGRQHRFYIFHRTAFARQNHSTVLGDWAWKHTADGADALRFLNGADPYRGPVGTARIATTHRDERDEYFVFHRQDGGRSRPGHDWRWHTVGSAEHVRDTVDHRGVAPMDFQLGAPPGGHGAFQVFTNPRVPAVARPDLVHLGGLGG